MDMGTRQGYDPRYKILNQYKITKNTNLKLKIEK